MLVEIDFILHSVVNLKDGPFQQGVAPAIGSTFKGQIVTAEILATIPAEKYPTEFFDASAGQMVGALGLIAVGFAVTALVAKIGGGGEGSA